MARRYGEGERPGKALVETIRRPRFSNCILEISSPEGTLQRDTADILTTFTAYYSALYTSQRRDHFELDSFLGGIALGWLGHSQGEF